MVRLGRAQQQVVTTLDRDDSGVELEAEPETRAAALNN